MEFNVEKSEDGRMKAIDVSGPEGACVQGAPRRMQYGGRGGAGGGRGGGRGRGRGRGRGEGEGGEGAPPADGA